MKRRVRIYKAQLGGAQALQEQQAQVQEQSNDQALLASIVAKLDEEEMAVMPEDILRDLMNAGVEQEKAARLVRAAMDLKEERDALSQAENEGDQDAVDDLEADQQALADQAEQDRQDAILAQMYESDAYDDGYDDEDQFVQDNIMESNLPAQKMGGIPDKRTFVRRVSKTIKAQMGQEMPNTKADSTDTGARQMMMASFLKSVQDTGNNALIQKDAEQAYDMTSMYPYSEDNTPQAQFGGTRGQQRRMNRRLNRMIGHMPIPMNGMMPAGFVTYPMLQNMQQYMPAEGSYYGGPQLANIDVHKTGLFGRPKEYTITFAQEAFNNPTLRKQVIKQEARNRHILTEDEVDELLKKEEEITGKTTETAKAEEKKEAEGRKDISGSGATSRQNTSPNRVNPAVQQSPAVEEETAAVEQTPAPWESALQGRNPEWMGDVNFQANQGYVNPMDAAMQNYAKDKQAFNTGAYPSGPPREVAAKSAYSNKTTSPDLFYYNPDKPGYSYVFKDGKLYYDDATDAAQSWHEIKDPARIQTLNEKLKGADIYTLPGKANVYYRQRPDGSFAKFEGDPAKHSVSAKQVAVIKPGSKNYDYLNKNKQYSYSFSGKMQAGGFTDASSGLTKFVYGGDEYGLPETGGKLVNSPYFEEGGFLPEAQDGKDVKRHIVRAYQDGKFVGYMDQETADKYGLYWESATKDNTTTEKTDDGYNSNPQSVFPGGYAKQKGLPYDPVTGETYYGGFSPYGQINKIDVTKTRMLSGLPRKYTVHYTDYFPTESSSNESINQTSIKPIEPKENFSRLKDFSTSVANPVRRAWTNKIEPGLENLYNNSIFSGIVNTFKKEEGGTLPKAQTGVNYPYLNDKRLYPDLPSEEEQEAFISGAGQLSPASVYNSEPIPYTDALTMKDYVRNQVNKEGIDPRAFGTEEELKPILANPKEKAIDFRVKNTREENMNSLLALNQLVNSGLNAIGERGNKQRKIQMSNRLLGDNLYGSTGLYDRGTYEINSGLFRPDQMGFKGVAKEGGAMYKEGGTHYMSAEQVKKFLEEGGELEFV